jgi:hypothetical protein
VIRKIFESESRIDLLSGFYNGQDVSLSMNGQYVQVFCLLLMYFAKAIDKVPHKRLLHKLCHSGVRGKTLQWITSFFSSRTQQVLVEGCESAKLYVLSGVPQVTVLDPLLFLV